MAENRKGLLGVDIPDDLKGLLGLDSEDNPPLVSEDAGDVLVRAVFAGPAPFANRFLITGSQGVIRLGFADQYDTNTVPQFRSAVALSMHTAAELVSILRQYLIDQVGAEKPAQEASDGEG
jgi:hypothetical protein